MIKGHFFFKWLFLTVLSVSVLHFRENSSFGHYRTEQISFRESITGKRVPGFEYCQKLSKARHTSFAYFKATQQKRLTDLSHALSASLSQYPELTLHQAPGQVHIQNQHFRSRTLSSDDHSISRS
jgi:hypothetical protein